MQLYENAVKNKPENQQGKVWFHFILNFNHEIMNFVNHLFCYLLEKLYKSITAAPKNYIIQFFSVLLVDR